MEQQVTLTLDRADAEILVKSLEHRKERLCDIKQELCEPDPFEQELADYCEQEEAVIGRVMTALRALLERALAEG